MPKKVEVTIKGIRMMNYITYDDHTRMRILFRLNIDDYITENKKYTLPYNPDLSINDIKTLLEDLYK